MSEYCDIFPEDPSCVVEEPVEEPTDSAPVDDGITGDDETTGGDNEEGDAEVGDDMDEVKDEMEEEMMEKMEKMDWDMKPSQMWMKAAALMEFTSLNPFMGEITYLMVAIGMTTQTALDLFRYVKDDQYLAVQTGDSVYSTTGGLDGTNWFKIGDQIQKYIHLVVFGIAAISQILSGLGIAPYINMLIWFWLVMGLGSVGSLLGMTLKFIGYETGYKNKDIALNSVGTQNVAAMAVIKSMMVESIAVETCIALTLYMQDENWKFASWDALTQERKEKKIMDDMAKIEEWDAEMMAEMEGEMKEDKSEDDTQGENADEEAEEAEKEQ